MSLEAALISFLGSGDGDDSGFYAGSGTLKNQFEVLEGSDCIWSSSKRSGVGGGHEGLRSLIHGIHPASGIREWLGLEGTFRDHPVLP